MTERKIERQEKLITPEDLYSASRSYGYEVRKNRVNGLDAWNEVKSHIGNDSDTAWNYEPEKVGGSKVDLPDYYDYVHVDLGMKGGDGDEELPHWEECHFPLQLLARIPLNNGMSVKRLAQLAYNHGQFDAQHEKTPNFYPKDILKLCSDCNASTFIGNHIFDQQTLWEAHNAIHHKIAALKSL